MPDRMICSRPRPGLFLIYCLATFVWSVGVAPAFGQDPPTDMSAVPVDDGLFMHIVRSAGPLFGGILLLMSICLVALIVLLTMDTRLSVAIPPSLVEQFTDLVNKRKFKEAFDICRNEKSYLGRVMFAGMSRLQLSLDDARDAALNAVESIKSNKDQLNNYVAVICSMGPLIGLVGTVFGMIKSFKVLATATQIKPAELADGISHALVITMLGIGLAVPGVFFNAFFRNRINRISMDVANLSDDLLTQVYHNSRKAVPAPVAAAVDAPAAPAGAAP